MIPLKVLGLPRFPEVGQIKIGAKGEERKKKDGSGTYRQPVKLDYFLVTKRSRDEAGVNLELDEQVMEALDAYCAARPGYEKGKPRRIPIFLPYDDPNANCFSYLGLFRGPDRLCWNDTGTDKARRVERGGQKVPEYEVECVCPLLQQGKCKEHYRLRVIIRLPGIPFGGFYVYRTTSKEGGRNILGNMAGFMHESGGVLAGLPLELVCDDVTKKNPDGQQVRVTVCHLEFPGGQDDLFKTIVDVRKSALERKQLIGTINKEQQLLIAKMDSEAETADAAEVGEEFHPDTQDSTIADVTTTPQDPNPPGPGKERSESVRKRRSPAPVVDTQKVEKPKPSEEPEEEPDGRHDTDFSDAAEGKDTRPTQDPPPVAPEEGDDEPLY